MEVPLRPFLASIQENHELLWRPSNDYWKFCNNKSAGITELHDATGNKWWVMLKKERERDHAGSETPFCFQNGTRSKIRPQHLNIRHIATCTAHTIHNNVCSINYTVDVRKIIRNKDCNNRITQANLVKRNMQHLTHTLFLSSHPTTTHACLINKSGSVRIT